MRRYHAAGLFGNSTPKAPILVKLWKKQNHHPHGYQVRSGQVRTDSLLMEIITPLVTPGVVQKSGQMDRDGA